MNSKDEQILIDLHEELMEEIDPRYLVDFLFSHRVLTRDDCQRLTQTEPRCERTRELLFLLPRSLSSLDLFCDALFECGYEWLKDKIQEQNSRKSTFFKQRKCRPFGTHRTKLVGYRHRLKKLTHFGKHSEFSKEYDKMEKSWKMALDTKFDSMSALMIQELADYYFYALDAYCEYKRLIFDKTFVKSDIFGKIRELTKYTSDCNIPNMLCSARYGSSIFMTNENDFEEAHSYIKEAKQKFDLVKSCRETGIVLYIEYNMFQKRYSEAMDYAKKEHLLQLGNEAVRHFKTESKTNPEVAEDFVRMFNLKLSHLYLGIGLFGNFLNTPVAQKEIQQAKFLLGLIEKKETWDRMEVRWKWFYYTAKARVSYLEKNLDDSLSCARLGLNYALEGNYPNEISCSKDVINHIKSLVLNQRNESS